MNPQLYIPLLTTPLPQKVPKATTTHRQVYIRESSPMSHSTEKPTVLLVHGAWHTASCWDVTRAELKKLSYPTEVVQLKSSGNAVSTHLEDTAIIRNALEALIVSDAKKVILVMHSYGGIPGTNAVHGLEAAARQDKGEEGGIIHCLFVAAFLVPKGKSLLGMFPEAPPYLCPDPEGSRFLLVRDPKSIFFNDVSPDVAEPWISQLKPQSIAAFASAVDSVAWESGLVACTYLMCEKDKGVYFWLQEQMFDAVSKESGRPWTVEKIDSSHSAWLTQVPTIIRLIEAATGA